MLYHFSLPSLFSCCRLVLLACCLSACDSGGGDGDGRSSPQVTADELADIQAYIDDGQYNTRLKSCVLSAREEDYCLLSELPLLVADASQPSVEDIMGRVLVSHDWMGLRFRQVLETMPPEILQLFSALTSIVIDDDVRPAYFSARSSTMFIDPAYLWLDNTEKATISRQPDYRSDFANELAFISLARYVDGFDYAWPYYSLDGDEERGLADIRLLVAKLLLHELAHANDFFPPDQAPYLQADQTIDQALNLLNGQAIYRRLQQQYPLTSTTMFGLGEVMYQGAPASAAQQQLTALEVGEALELDAANDDYAYSSPLEDVAMLFEEAMMKYLFNIDRDVAYSNRPSVDEIYCEDLFVAWGERGRVGSTDVKERAQLVVEAIYPGRDFSLFFQDLAAPTAMRRGEDWCENLALF